MLRTVTDLGDLTADQEQELDDASIEQLRQRLWTSHALVEQAEILDLLRSRLGGRRQPDRTGRNNRSCARVARGGLHQRLHCQDWNVLRRCAGAMGMVHPQLEDALTDLLLRQTQVVVGRNYTSDSRLMQPRSSNGIAALIQSTVVRTPGAHGWSRKSCWPLTGSVARKPGLLKGTLTMQLGQLLLLLDVRTGRRAEPEPGRSL